jgi:hypothetical protein
MKKQHFYPTSKYILMYKSINNAIVFLMLLALTNCLFATKSYAIEQSLQVSSIISDIRLIPGQSTVINLSVENLSNEALGIHTEISGLDETNQNIFTDQHPSILTKWTGVATPDIILDPLSQKYIPVTINTPKDAKPSGYYEIIFLSPIVSSQKQPTSPIVLTRIGAIVLATIGKPDYNDLAKKVVIQGFKPSAYLLEKSPVTLSFSVENRYFTHFTAKPFITIKPLFGQEQTALLEEKHILPGTNKSWQFQTKLGKNIFYRAKLAVSVGNGNQILADTWLVVLPYKSALVLILILGIFYFILFKRDRITKAIEVLLGKS